MPSQGGVPTHPLLARPAEAASDPRAASDPSPAARARAAAAAVSVALPGAEIEFRVPAHQVGGALQAIPALVPGLLGQAGLVPGGGLAAAGAARGGREADAAAAGGAAAAGARPDEAPQPDAGFNSMAAFFGSGLRSDAFASGASREASGLADPATLPDSIQRLLSRIQGGVPQPARVAEPRAVRISAAPPFCCPVPLLPRRACCAPISSP